MTTYILFFSISIILFFIAKLVYKRFFSNSLEAEILRIPYSITKDCTFPSFNNSKIVKGEYPYVKFDYKEVFYLRDSKFKALPLLSESTIQAGSCYFSTVPAQLGYNLIRCTLYPNRDKLYTFYELIEIKERHLVFKKMATLDNFDQQKNYPIPRLKKAMEYVEFVLNFNPRN